LLHRGGDCKNGRWRGGEFVGEWQRVFSCE
jgi:hypothetical protein